MFSDLLLPFLKVFEMIQTVRARKLLLGRIVLPIVHKNIYCYTGLGAGCGWLVGWLVVLLLGWLFDWLAGLLVVWWRGGGRGVGGFSGFCKGSMRHFCFLLCCISHLSSQPGCPARLDKLVTALDDSQLHWTQLSG